MVAPSLIKDLRERSIAFDLQTYYVLSFLTGKNQLPQHILPQTTNGDFRLSQASLQSHWTHVKRDEGKQSDFCRTSQTTRGVTKLRVFFRRRRNMELPYIPYSPRYGTITNGDM